MALARPNATPGGTIYQRPVCQLNEHLTPPTSIHTFSCDCISLPATCGDLWRLARNRHGWLDQAVCVRAGKTVESCG
jgi:hypothetical protein